MRVIAREMGYDGNARRRPGEEFDIAEDAFRRDGSGKPILPRWVLPATDEARAQIEEFRNARDAKMVAGALKASGDGASGGASKRKGEQFVEAINRSHAGDKLKVSGGGSRSSVAPARSESKGSDGN